jgi:RNA polymerase sigma-70 factor (ECF subfamily)
MPHSEVAMTDPPAPEDAPFIRSALDLYEGRLLRYATRLLGDVDAARDVVQDTFLRLCREDAARLTGRLPQWLFRVCRNRALDVRRRESARPGVEGAAPLDPAPPPTPAPIREEREALHAVLAVMATLPASQQAVLRLKLQEGLGYAEIAAVTGLTANHVGVLVHLGLKAIRARVRRPAASPGRES